MMVTMVLIVIGTSMSVGRRYRSQLSAHYCPRIDQRSILSFVTLKSIFLKALTACFKLTLQKNGISSCKQETRSNAVAVVSGYTCLQQ